MSTKQKMIDYLKENHVGADNALMGNRLCSMLGIKGGLLRKIINELRNENYAVCSDSNGYFYASCVEEIDMTTAYLDSRSREIQLAIEGLLKSKNEFCKDGDLDES